MTTVIENAIERRSGTRRLRSLGVWLLGFSWLMALSPMTQASESASADAAADQTANVQVIRTLYDAFARADVNGIVGLMNESVVWQVPGPSVIPFAGTWKGHEGVRQFFDSAVSTLDVLDQKVTGFLTDGNRVGALGYERMRVKATGKEYVTSWVHLYTLEGQKIVAFEEFVDTAAQAAAFAPSNDEGSK